MRNLITLILRYDLKLEISLKKRFQKLYKNKFRKEENRNPPVVVSGTRKTLSGPNK